MTLFPTIRNSNKRIKIRNSNINFKKLYHKNKMKYPVANNDIYIAQLQIDQQKYNKINCRQYNKRGINMICVLSTNRFVR